MKLNSTKLKLFFINYICAIIEDTQYFNSYFKKKFPRSFKYLPLIKFITLLLMATLIYIDSQSHLSVLNSIDRGDLEIDESIYENKLEENISFYSKYTLCFFFVVITYEYFVSIYIVFHVGSPVKNVFFQVVKKTMSLVSFTVTNAFVYSYLPFAETSDISNFVHTKTPFGRGFDYVHNLRIKIKGEIVSSALGSVEMLKAIDKHSPGDRVIGSVTLFHIMQDPEFKPKIEASISENQYMYLYKEVFDHLLDKMIDKMMDEKSQK